MDEESRFTEPVELRKEKLQREAWQDGPPESAGQASGTGDRIAPESAGQSSGPGEPVRSGSDCQSPGGPGNLVPPPEYESQSLSGSGGAVPPPGYGGQPSGSDGAVPPPGYEGRPSGYGGQPSGSGGAVPPPGYGSQSSGPGNPVPPGGSNQPPPWYGSQASQAGGAYYWQEPVKSESMGFGIASLVLGILSILLFCTCINWLTGILAIIFGIVQLVKGGKKGLAVGGIVTAALSILFTIAFYFLMYCLGSESYNDYYDYYDYYKDYYNDSYGSDREEFL